MILSKAVLASVVMLVEKKVFELVVIESFELMVSIELGNIAKLRYGV